MMSAREIAARDEEEEVDEEEGREEGVVRSIRATSIGSTHGRFAISCTTFYRIDSLLIAPMT